MEFGEDVEQGCLREVFEETGLAVRLEGLLTVNTVCDQTTPAVAVAESRRLTGHHFPPGPAEMYSVRVVYSATVLSGELTNEFDGSTDVAEWVPLADVRKLPIVDLVTATSNAWNLR